MVVKGSGESASSVPRARGLSTQRKGLSSKTKEFHRDQALLDCFKEPSLVFPALAAVHDSPLVARELNHIVT